MGCLSPLLFPPVNTGNPLVGGHRRLRRQTASPLTG